MLTAFLLLVPVAVVALVSEYLWRKRVLRGEGGRKFIHILLGIWIGFWPYFISYRAIVWLGVALTVGLFVSQSLHIFHAVHDRQIKRWTIGEFFYPVAIVVCAWVAPPEWVFLLAMLYLAVADGFAAVVGTRYKRLAGVYKVFGQTKSILGTGTYVVSAVLMSMIVFGVLSPSDLLLTDYLPLLIAVVIASACIENLLPYGTDNLLIPLFVVLALQ